MCPWLAISPRRLLALDPQQQRVSFAWKDYADGARSKIMTLAVGEFVRRFCLHLLPERFVKIRHYGLLGNRQRQSKVACARALLSPPKLPDSVPAPGVAPEACPRLRTRLRRNPSLLRQPTLAAHRDGSPLPRTGGTRTRLGFLMSCSLTHHTSAVTPPAITPRVGRKALRLGRAAPRAVGPTGLPNGPRFPSHSPCWPAAEPSSRPCQRVACFGDKPPPFTFPYNPGLVGSAVQFNTSVSAMPALTAKAISALLTSRHGGYTASGRREEHCCERRSTLTCALSLHRQHSANLVSGLIVSIRK
jgi:hypothetical protein